MSAYTDVVAWHRAAGVPVADRPLPLTPDRLALRLALLAEEYRELVEALEAGDVAGAAKEAADLITVVLGTDAEQGIDSDAVWAEVHRSNMAKLGTDGTVVRRADGKILKPAGWTAPDIAAVLAGSVTGHIIRVHDDPAADLRTYTFECYAPVGSPCRRWCIKPGCDWEHGLPHWGDTYDKDADDTPHPAGDSGECLRVTWLNAYDIADCVDDDVDLDAVEDNAPITIRWDFDSYIWTLAAATTPERAA